MTRAGGFAAAGASGILVNLGVMWVLASPSTLRVQYLLAAILATQLSSTWNFLLVDHLVYRGPKRSTLVLRYLGFMAMSNAFLLIRVPMLAVLVGTVHLHYLLATLCTLVIGYLARFSAQERLTLKGTPR
ncbi:MAG: GtrA family protein [Nocardioidaceae bacterium]